MSDSATAIPELTEYLQRLIDAGNYDAVKQLLNPEQPVDAAEAISNLPTLQAIAFRLLLKDEAIESPAEHSELAVQSNRCWSACDPVRCSSWWRRCPRMTGCVSLMSCPPRWCAICCSSLSPDERRVTAELPGYESETAGRLMTTEFIGLKEFTTAAQALEIVRRQASATETVYTFITDGSPPDRHPVVAAKSPTPRPPSVR